MRRIKLLLLSFIPLLLGTCHYKYTAPFFWKHQSSTGADFAFGGFVFIAILAFVVAGIIASEWSKPS